MYKEKDSEYSHRMCLGLWLSLDFGLFSSVFPFPDVNFDVCVAGRFFLPKEIIAQCLDPF